MFFSKCEAVEFVLSGIIAVCSLSAVVCLL